MQFRFDANAHEYIALDTGETLPHITGMLKAAELVDDRWFTDNSRRRGSIVHRLTTDYDLGALEPSECQSEFRNYLLGYVKAIEMIGRPDWSHVEIPMVSDRYRFGGRPDRAGIMYGGLAILEIKSGAPEASHPIQTALQAILLAQEARVPAESILRFALYLRPNGMFKLERHPRRQDVSEALGVIKRTCGRER